MRYRKGWKNRSGFDQESLEKELRHKMILEDQVCLGSVKMIEVAKSETQVVEASKTMMLSYARLESLKKELSSVNKGANVSGKRSRQAEVSLTSLRIPLAWRQSEQNLSDKSKFAIFCTITSGTQIFDTSVKIVDSSCADISFPESFVFSNMSPDFDVKIEVFSHRMKGMSSKRKGLMKWFHNVQNRVGVKSKFLKNRKAINFKTLTTKHLSLDDCSSKFLKL